MHSTEMPDPLVSPAPAPAMAPAPAPAHDAAGAAAQPQARWRHALVHEFQIGLFDSDAATGESRWDHRLLRMFDLPVNGPMPTVDDCHAMIDPLDRPRAQALWDESLASGRPGRYVVRATTPAGRRLWVECEWVHSRTTDGRRMTTGFVRDITVALASREQQQHLRDQLVLAAEATQVGLLQEDLADRRLTVNDAARRLFDLPADEPATHEALNARIHPADRAHVDAEWQAYRRGQPGYESELRYRVVRRDGSVAHVLSHKRLRPGQVAGTAVGYGTVIDETPMVQAREREARLSESRAMALSLAGLGRWELPEPRGDLIFDEALLAMYGWAGRDARVPVADWFAALHPADVESRKADFARLVRGELTGGKALFRIVRPDGELRMLHTVFTRVTRADGGWAVQGVSKDTTDELRLQQASRSQQKLLVALQGLARVGSWRRVLATDQSWWSPELYRIMRRDPRQGPRPSAELQRWYSPASWEAVQRAREQALRNLQPYELDIEFVREDGERAWGRYMAEFELDSDGRPVAHRGNMQDITETVLARRAADETQQRLQAMFDGTLNALVIGDDAGHVFDANPAACRMLGMPLDDLRRRGLGPLEVAVDGEVMPFWPRIVRARRQRERVLLHRYDGSRIAVDCVSVSHLRPGQHLCVMSDVTAQVQAEAALKDAQRRLREFALRQADEFDALRAELARNVHDQLGQLLGALKLDIDLVESMLPRTLMAGATVARMRALLRDGVSTVRDVSRTLRPAALDLGLVPALRGLGAEMSMRSDVDIEVAVSDPAPDLPEPACRALFRIAQEALTNAARHAQATRIVIRLHAAGGHLLLEIHDDGIGFDDAAPDRGAGLGMLGMRERAAQMGAAFSVDSAPGVGTRVSVMLPDRSSPKTLTHDPHPDLRRP